MYSSYQASMVFASGDSYTMFSFDSWSCAGGIGKVCWRMCDLDLNQKPPELLDFLEPWWLGPWGKFELLRCCFFFVAKWAKIWVEVGRLGVCSKVIGLSGKPTWVKQLWIDYDINVLKFQIVRGKDSSLYRKKHQRKWWNMNIYIYRVYMYIHIYIYIYKYSYMHIITQKLEQVVLFPIMIIVFWSPLHQNDVQNTKHIGIL